MSTVYNPEAETIAKIEQLELTAKELRRKIEHVQNAEDKRVLDQQLAEMKDRMEFLRHRLP